MRDNPADAHRLADELYVSRARADEDGPGRYGPTTLAEEVASIEQGYQDALDALDARLGQAGSR